MTLRSKGVTLRLPMQFMFTIYMQWAKDFSSSNLIPGTKGFISSKLPTWLWETPPPHSNLSKLRAQCSVAGVLCLGLKRPGREVGQLPHSSVEFVYAWNYSSRPLKCWFFLLRGEILDFPSPTAVLPTNCTILKKQPHFSSSFL